MRIASVRRSRSSGSQISIYSQQGERIEDRGTEIDDRGYQIEGRSIYLQRGERIGMESGSQIEDSSSQIKERILRSIKDYSG